MGNMVEQLDTLEVTLAQYKPDFPLSRRGNNQFAKIFSEVTHYHAQFSKPIYEGMPIFYFKRDFLLSDTIERLNESRIRANELYVKVDPSFFEPQYPDADLARTIRKEFDSYGRENNVRVTYEGLD